MIPGYVAFEFDLPRFLLEGLSEQLDGIESAQLTGKNLARIPEVQGVYQLFIGGRLVYIGKTDADAGLDRRLNRHWKHVQHRLNLDPDDVWFKAARVFVFTAVDLEDLLISHYRRRADDIGEGGVLEWNDSGFGSNDPGRSREMTRYKEGHFDMKYPIDIDREICLDLANTATAAGILNALKAHLPYVFRFQGEGNSRRPHQDLRQTEVAVAGCIPLSARSVISRVVGELPGGWRASKLPGRVILYKNDDGTYPEVEDIARSL